MRRVAFAILIALVLPSGLAIGQEREDAAARPVPKLPGAVTEAPAWLLKDAPFDVAKFFKAPPHDRNAAPLYLDALFEFYTEVASCFPNDATTLKRDQAVRQRTRRWAEIDDALERNPSSVPAAAIDALLAEYEDGFRKLAAAQRRPACVFQTGIGVDTLIPHAQAARYVARIAKLRVRRALERGDLDRPIRDVETVLRLSRDIRPRGFNVSQMSAVAIAGVCDLNLIKSILAAPGLRPEHCDRLIRILREHEARALDPMAEALKAEYVMIRSAIRAGRSVAPIASVPEANLLITRLNTFYRDLEDQSGAPYVARVALEDLFIKGLPRDVPADRRVADLIGEIAPLDEVFTRSLAIHRGTACLVALRRWQLTSKKPPTDLAAIVKAAGMEAVPIDPFDGNPLKMNIIEGVPVIYSIGKDGRDDRAILDSNNNQVPGDLIFRAPRPPG